MIATYTFYFAQPWWLLMAILAVPMAWMGLRTLRMIGPKRRILAIVLRTAVVVLLAALLARPTIGRESKQLSLIVVLDRSESIPPKLQSAARSHVAELLGGAHDGDRLAIIDFAEAASIAQLPSSMMKIPERNTTLTCRQSNLAAAVRMAMAIAPPDTAIRILLISDGNETEGSVLEACRIAAANGIAIDVLPLRYAHQREVVFKRLVTPPKARGGQTVPVRFILHSTSQARGRLMLMLNGQPVDMDPGSPAFAVTVELEPGTNVRTVSLPMGLRGVHEFEARFEPESPDQDGIVRNNQASSITYVAGPGRVLVVDTDTKASQPIVEALGEANIETTYCHARSFPVSLTQLMDVDAIVLADVDSTNFSYQQQEMISRYVTELGGGLVIAGGPNSFGAGGWIGSPIARIAPVDMDPPQKKQMPKGALVLVMHACEMSQGNYWGKRVATMAVNSLSRRDLVGVIDYGWNTNALSNWVYPLSPVGDRKTVTSAIAGMQMGDMPDFHAPLQAAYQKLKDCKAAQKHVIIISDGDPSMPSKKLLGQMKQAGITCTGVAVFPHTQADVQSLQIIAAVTGGRFYNVNNANMLPKIFVKEAQVVRRSLINEETFTPEVTYSLSEVIGGLGGSLPPLDGYVLTGPKGGLTQLVLARDNGDPILATGQAGLGRCVAFTSTADGRWASKWLSWPGYGRFWEQAVRWASKSARASDCEVLADVHGRDVTVTVEAVDAEGNFTQFAEVTGQVIDPEMSTRPLTLRQIGPGRYRAEFRADHAGSHLLAIRYRKASTRENGQAASGLVEAAVTVPYAPEFRDLTDNAALLAEVANMTGGRVIDPSAAGQGLFERGRIRFPQTAMPLTRPLLLVLLAAFLLDVAVRRLAPDFAAIGRRLRSWIPSRKAATAGATVDRLKLRRQQIKAQLRGRAAEVASRRYEADEDKTGDLPVAKTQQTYRRPAGAIEAPEDKTKAAPKEQATHLQQLLKAKRKTKGRLGDAGDDSEKTGD